MSLVLVGAGRLGRAVLEAAGESGPRVDAVVRRRADGAGLPHGTTVLTDLSQALGRFPRGVVVDTATGEGAAERIACAAGAGWALVEGGTALGPGADAALTEASSRVAVVVAPNFSPGAALLRRMLREIAGAAASWDAGIVDRHHAAKRDAPSGTARELAALLQPEGAVPIVSVRQGGVLGEHTVHLAAEDEELVLTHRVLSRRVFARGALLAVRFAATAAPGRYGMEDVLEGD